MESKKYVLYGCGLKNYSLDNIRNSFRCLIYGFDRFLTFVFFKKVFLKKLSKRKYFKSRTMNPREDISQ